MSDAPARIPVVMCTWRRPKYFRRTLRALAAQSDVSVELHVWNNNPAISEQLEAAAAEGPLPVRFHSPENIGGFGRFHFASELAPSHPHVVFIDDDQLFGPRTIRTLVGEARPRTATEWWAYRFLFPPHYWLRVPVRRGRRAQYLGTCGMIIDTSVFLDDRVFECPDRFRLVEDVWLSYVAQHLMGWTLRRSRATFWFIPDTRNQFAGLIREKYEFLRYLTARGWLQRPG
ncbi:glycosyltransferase [Microbacterium sp. MEC084]|uniref:glycosyltransferase n=1 Tax=Microbacterium sp. MEC084 TaxID=1963027 RepID=UPI00143027A5|nr:glycosyltransferase [Microbacterium sp. MEC084]MCD1268919.1 glycosyltransferase [Microbacterium sp. MEC084]